MSNLTEPCIYADVKTKYGNTASHLVQNRGDYFLADYIDKFQLGPRGEIWLDVKLLLLTVLYTVCTLLQ